MGEAAFRQEITCAPPSRVCNEEKPDPPTAPDFKIVHEWSVDLKHWQQKFSAKLKLGNQITEPDSRRSCLSLACLGGINTLQPDTVLGVGVIEDGNGVGPSAEIITHSSMLNA